MFTASIAQLRSRLKCPGAIIKRVLLYSIIIISSFVLYPFINGFGCDFSFTAENERFKINGECKNGILSYVTHFKNTNMLSMRKDLFGVVGHKVITVKLDRTIYAYPSPNLSQLSTVFDEYKLTSDVFRFYYWGRASEKSQNYERWFFLQKVNANHIASQMFTFDVPLSAKLSFLAPD